VRFLGHHRRKGNRTSCSATDGSPHKLRSFRDKGISTADATSQLTNESHSTLDSLENRQYVENRTNDALQALRRRCHQRGNPEILYPDSRRCQGTFLRCIHLHVRYSITSPTPQQKPSLALASYPTHNPSIAGRLDVGLWGTW
jgi:hypothetical protein